MKKILIALLVLCTSSAAFASEINSDTLGSTSKDIARIALDLIIARDEIAFTRYAITHNMVILRQGQQVKIVYIDFDCGLAEIRCIGANPVIWVPLASVDVTDKD